MNTARSQHTATLLADGRVLLAGGAQGSTILSSAEIYDPSTGLVAPTGDLTVPRVLHIATLLADGRVLIFGNATAELYDPSIGTFTATGNMTTPHGCNAALLKNGKVLLVDDPPPFGSSATALLYDPDTGTFAPTGAYASTAMAEQDHKLFPSYGDSNCPRAIPLADGRVLIAGGIFAEIYDPDVGAFSITGRVTTSNGFMETVPQGWLDPGTAALLLDGTVLFDGGDGDLGPAYGGWIYDPSSGTFTGTGNMTTPRESNTITLLPDGKVLVAGSFETGGFQGGLPPRADASAEVYDPAARAFTPGPDMTTPRYSHTATLLNNGRVLIAGGITGAYPGYQNLSSAELYTPAVLLPAPRLFSLAGDGTGQGAIWHADTAQIASGGSPATAGEVLSMYTTGLIAGSVIRPQVAVGGKPAEVLYFGGAPGYPAYDQVNFRLPNGVAPGPIVSVRLTYLGRPSNEVAIGVK